jgi:probable HAF family extracellular repeat protein
MTATLGLLIGLLLEWALQYSMSGNTYTMFKFTLIAVASFANRRNAILLPMAATILILAGLQTAQAQPEYRVTVIAPGFGNGINSQGDVCGTLSSNSHAFLYKKGRLTDLGVLAIPPNSTNNSSFAYELNDSDIVVGHIFDASGGGNFAEDSFLDQKGKMVVIATGSGDGGFGSEVGGINNAGEVVGTHDAGGSTTATPPVVPLDAATPRAFFYRNGQLFDVGTLGGDFSYGLGINNAGQIVGISDTTAGPFHWEAFLYSNGRMQVIGGAQTVNFTPVAINDNGWITGTLAPPETQSPANGGDSADPTVPDPSNPGFAVLYVGGQLTNLGTLARFTGSEGVSINNSGTIIGELTGGPTPGAFIYTGGRMFNLNHLVEGGWKITDVGHINDAGQIAATGTMPGSAVTYALLLAPTYGRHGASILP